MPLYRYKALDAHGEMLDGQMEAASDAEVALRLQEQGHLPVETRLATGENDSPSLRMLLRKKPFDNAALVQFTQQLATLIGAGQPLDRALSILMDLPEDEKSRRVIGDVRDTVRGGASLSSALERQHGLFSKLYINMVRAGEAGGSMQDTLQRLADYLERSRALRGKVINALIYPAILLAVVGCALLFLLGYVVPQFAQMYESLDVALPWFTQAVLSVGLLVRELVAGADRGAGRTGAVAGSQASQCRIPCVAGRMAAAPESGRQPHRAAGNRTPDTHVGHLAAQWRAAAGGDRHRA